MSTTYKIFCTPKYDATHYGSEIDISDWVDQMNVGQIVRSIDSTDYDIGVYTYSDIQLICSNEDGYLSDNKDSRSIFQYSRDLAKIRIEFDQDSNAPTRFIGLIVDEASRTDVENESVNLRVLGLDAVVRKSQIPQNTITNGMTAKNALLAILNTSDITAVLNVSTPNINPSNNISIDDGSKFDNKAKDEAINEILLATNSVMLIDSSNNVIVQSRADNPVNILYLYGKGNAQGRENIIGVKNYNVGIQRVFNSIVINDATEVHDSTSIAIYGLRQKKVTLDWLTNSTNQSSVGNALLAQFKYPKIELEVTVPTEIAYGYNLLDRVSIDYPLFVHPTGPFLPVCGITVCNDPASPLPTIRGAVIIDPSIAFKIIEMTEDVKNFTTTLKIRQIGVSLTDGTF